jgi:hypothetical protein
MEEFGADGGKLKPPEHCLKCPDLAHCKEKVKDALSKLKDADKDKATVVVGCEEGAGSTEDVLSKILGGGKTSFSGLASMLGSTGKVGRQFVPQLIHLNPSEIVTLLTLVGVEMARQTNTSDAATAMREIAKVIDNNTTNDMLNSVRDPKRKPPPPPATTNN